MNIPNLPVAVLERREALADVATDVVFWRHEAINPYFALTAIFKGVAEP